jgi:hypothetical protein
VAVLLPWLAKPSHNETLRRAALGGLGETRDLAALDTLLTWTKKGKPRECRSVALGSLGKLAQTANPSDEQRQQIVTATAACLDNEGPRLKRTAVEVLRDLGRSAAPTVATLEAIGRHDPSDNLRELAKKAVEQIRANQPVPVELTRLREELDRIKQANEKVQERVEKVEKGEKKGM